MTVVRDSVVPTPFSPFTKKVPYSGGDFQCLLVALGRLSKDFLVLHLVGDVYLSGLGKNLGFYKHTGTQASGHANVTISIMQLKKDFATFFDPLSPGTQVFDEERGAIGSIR
uniref:TGc domain-containing protein n=1 Tax=Steinernema glaseri TaxID=37863 RepID=A0A1I8A361_9BILA